MRTKKSTKKTSATIYKELQKKITQKAPKSQIEKLRKDYMNSLNYKK